MKPGIETEDIHITPGLFEVNAHPVRVIDALSPIGVWPILAEHVDGVHRPWFSASVVIVEGISIIAVEIMVIPNSKDGCG